jgi:hypothetical protein
MAAHDLQKEKKYVDDVLETSQARRVLYSGIYGGRHYENVEGPGTLACYRERGNTIAVEKYNRLDRDGKEGSYDPLDDIYGFKSQDIRRISSHNK